MWVMRIEADIDDKAHEYLRRMADESKFSIEDLVEVAVYNLVALWLRDKHPEESLVSDDVVDGGMGISGDEDK